MLYFERIDVSEVIDVNKRSASKKCDITIDISGKINFNFNQMSAIDVMIS